MRNHQQNHRVNVALIFACVALVTTLLTGCVKSDSNQQTAVGDEKPIEYESSPQAPPMTEAKDALKDAEQAITELDYRLLAFTNKVIHFPGIDAEAYSIDWIEQHCGIHYLKGSGDILNSLDNGSARSELKRYASIYNPRILKGCLDNLKNQAES